MTCGLCGREAGRDEWNCGERYHVVCWNEYTRRRDGGLCVWCGSDNKVRNEICLRCSIADSIQYSGYPPEGA